MSDFSYYTQMLRVHTQNVEGKWILTNKNGVVHNNNISKGGVRGYYMYMKITMPAINNYKC